MSDCIEYNNCADLVHICNNCPKKIEKSKNKLYCPTCGEILIQYKQCPGLFCSICDKYYYGKVTMFL